MKGIITAGFTFWDANGALDAEATKAYCDFQVKAGVDGLFIIGSTGEFATMDVATRKQAAEMYKKALDSRLPLIIHTGALLPEEAFELTEHAAALGADAVAAVPPFYYPYDQDALFAYFSQLAVKAGDTPVYLYNFPAAAKNDLPPVLVKRLMDAHSNIVGVKDTSQDYTRYVDYTDILGKNATVFMGSDAMLLAALVMGGAGCITATAACFPEVMVDIKKEYEAGNLERARELQLLASRLRLLFGKAPGLPIRKAGLVMRGFNSPLVNFPMRQLKGSEFEQFSIAVRALEKEFSYTLTAPINE